MIIKNGVMKKMETYESSFINEDDYGISFSEEAENKVNSVFAAFADSEIKSYAANVLIGNYAAKKVSDSVNDEFELLGYFVKSFKFREDNKTGKFTIMFGIKDGQPCAYSTASEKIYDSLIKISAIYGSFSNFTHGIRVRIRKEEIKNSNIVSIAYTLLVM